MIKVGVIGEHIKNDAEALIALLRQNPDFSKDKIGFIPFMGQFSGDQLKREKFFRELPKQIRDKKILLVFKDADALLSEKKKIEIEKSWFARIEKSLKDANIKGCQCILFLVIYEAEALIVADIDTFNSEYNARGKKSNPLFLENPKEELIKLTLKTSKKYQESDCSKLFGKLSFKKVYTNHKGEISFQSFINEFYKLTGIAPEFIKK